MASLARPCAPRRAVIIGLALVPLLCAALGAPSGVHAAGRASGRVTVRPADAAAIKRAIAAQRGRVVVVNFWATWCGPCVAEFPHLVSLHNRYRRSGLTVISVSSDMYKDRAAVRTFLVKQHAYFPNFLIRAKDPDAFIDAFDPKWHGDLPRTFIYDRRGRLVKILSGEQSLASFTTAVQPLLRK